MTVAQLVFVTTQNTTVKGYQVRITPASDRQKTDVNDHNILVLKTAAGVQLKHSKACVVASSSCVLAYRLTPVASWQA